MILYERLTSEFPDILFESCASGGARFDPGMLYYSPQTWTSDDTDAIERLKIQYGTSIVYPLSSIGAHVSDVPNHQVGRVTSLETRTNVAYFGAFGYELDVTKTTKEQKKIICEQVNLYKENRKLLQFGRFHRVISPFEGDYNKTCWIVVSEDQKEAIVGYYQILSKPQPTFDRIRITGLNSDYEYRVEDHSGTYYGDELMNVGIIVDEKVSGDFSSHLFKITAL